jgi:hypothetical protein
MMPNARQAVDVPASTAALSGALHARVKAGLQMFTNA